MADFCKQCEQELFPGEPSSDDLSGLVTKAQHEAGLNPNVICESCGPTIVDHRGYCISKNCTKNHGDY